MQTEKNSLIGKKVKLTQEFAAEYYCDAPLICLRQTSSLKRQKISFKQKRDEL